MPRVASSLLLAIALAGGLASPALALEDPGTFESEDYELRVTRWFAPMDDTPGWLVRVGDMVLPANESVLDRGVRLATGMGAGALTVYDAALSPWPRLCLGALSVVLLASGASGACPLYAALGVGTRPLFPPATGEASRVSTELRAPKEN